MPSPADREDSFEQLLRRSLQDRAAAPGACVGAETLASIVDGRVTAEAFGAAEAHLADCARCQATLAALVRTEPEKRPQAGWWRLPALRWLAPLTAAAAAAAIWVAVDRGPEVRHVRQSVEEASVPVQPTPAPRPLDDRLSTRPGTATDRMRNRASRPAAPIAPSAPQSVEARQRPLAPVEVPTQGGPPASTAPPASPPAAAELARPAPPVIPVGALPEGRAVDTARAFASSAVAGSAIRADTTVVSESVTVVRDITSSDPRYRWRLVGRAVQRSTDAGATWQDQATGVIGALTAGSAVSPEICWLVGDRGVVLVTVDGLSWQRLTAPADEALVSVSATSADAATVITRDGRTFATIDRGRTWSAK